MLVILGRHADFKQNNIEVKSLTYDATNAAIFNVPILFYCRDIINQTSPKSIVFIWK